MLSRNFRLQKVGDLQWLKKNYNFSELAFSIDELVLLDVTRTKRDHNKFIDHLRNLSEVCFIPIAAGGGIRDVKLAHRLVNNGADKIVINTLIGQSLETIRDIVAELGSQCVLASVDAKKIKNDYMVYTENGTLQQSFSLQEWLYKLACFAARECPSMLNIVELGTAAGISGMYLLAGASEESEKLKLFTFEGSVVTVLICK